MIPVPSQEAENFQSRADSPLRAVAYLSRSCNLSFDCEPGQEFTDLGCSHLDGTGSRLP